MEDGGYDHGAVGRFLADGVDHIPAARTTARELHTAYTEWMAANGLRKWTLTEAAFGRTVKDRGVEHTRTKNTIVYLGIAPKDTP